MEITWRVISRKGKEGEWGKIQGIRSINGRNKIDEGMVRTAQEIEKPKNIYIWLPDMNQGRGDAGVNKVPGRGG